MTSPVARSFASVSIALDRIDAPDVVMRETMSDEGLESLVASLQALGQLQELVVIQAGDRYRIAAGHRRYIGLQRAGFTHARCQVWPEGTGFEEAIKSHENEEREQVNPAAQATYYHWLLENRAGGDVEQLCRLVNRKESHVLDRLDLVQGDPAVLAALRDPSSRKSDSALAVVFPDQNLTKVGQITLAVAQELNKVKEAEYRRLFLYDAIVQGANSKVVRAWREQRAQAARYNEALAAHGASGAGPSTASAIVNIDECPLCHSSADRQEMEYVLIHRSCRAVFMRQQAAGERAGA